MSRPIKLTKELMEKAIAEFKSALAAAKMSDGKINYTKSFVYEEDDKAKILFDPLAYAKMLQLLTSFDIEVAWHGVGERVSDNVFRIMDILVYPQEVTTGTVEMDPAEYGKWEQKILTDHMEDERYWSFLMHGHSHVNGGTTPSGTDIKHQEAILAQLREDSQHGAYIFMIWNRRFEHTTKIFDLKNNTLYEDKDIEYGIYADDFDMAEFLAEAHKLAKKKTVTYQSQSYGQPGSYQQSAGAQQQIWSQHQTFNGQSTPVPAKAQSGAAQKPTVAGSEINKKKEKHRAGDYGSGYNGRGANNMSDEAIGFMLREKYGYED